LQGESFTVNLDSATNAVLEGEGADPTGQVLINPNEINAVDNPALSISDLVIDGEAQGQFLISLSDPTDQQVTVSFASENLPEGVSLPEPVTIAPGRTQTTATLEITADPATLQGESFTVNLDSATNAVLEGEGADPTGQVLINPNEINAVDNPALSISDLVIDGEAQGQFLISLSNPTDQDVTVDLSAELPDEVTLPGSVTIASGNTQTTATLELTGDAVNLQGESLTVTLENPQNASLEGEGADPTGQALINPNTIPFIETPGITISDVTINQGNTAEFTVSLSNASDQTVTVDFETGIPQDPNIPEDALATPGEDFTATSGTLEFDPGETRQTITVEGIDPDSEQSQGDNFVVNLSNPTDAEIDDDQGLGVIAPNADVGPNIVSIQDAQVTEGLITEEGQETALAVLTLSLTRAATETEGIIVTYITRTDLAGATATAGEDFVSVPRENPGPGKVTFEEGESQTTIEIEIEDDSNFEPDEIFFVELIEASGTGALFESEAANRAEVTITDVVTLTKAAGEDPVQFINQPDGLQQGGQEGPDLFRFTRSANSPNSNLTAQDQVDGGSNPEDNGDTIQIISEGEIDSNLEITDDQFEGVRNVEIFRPSNSNDNVVTLGDTAVEAGIRTINLEGIDDDKSQTIDFSDIDDTSLTVQIPNENLIPNEDREENYTIDGGEEDPGEGPDEQSTADTIEITNQGNLEDTAFTNVQGIEILSFALAVSNQITYGELAREAGILTIRGNLGDDIFEVSPENLNPEGQELSPLSIQGRDDIGGDTLEILGEGSINDSDLTSISGVEILRLSENGNEVTLGAEAVQAGLTTIDGSNTPEGTQQTIDISQARVAFEISGGAGIDSITGGDGNDTIEGGGSADLIEGGAGNDTIRGGDGDDFILDTQGENILEGGLGNDTFEISGESLGGTIDGGFGQDQIEIKVSSEGLQDEDFSGISNIEVFAIEQQQGRPDIILGQNFSDSGIATIDASIISSSLTIIGGELEEDITIAGTRDPDRITTGEGDDILEGNEGADVLNGGEGDDELSGGNDNDRLIGGAGEDVLEGGAGNDTLFSDTESSDRFIFNTGQAFDFAGTEDNLRDPLLGIDSIEDFVSGTDKVVLDDETFTALTTAAGAPLSEEADFATVDDDDDVNEEDAQIVYSTGSGGLFYKAEGETAQFATLDDAPTIQASDIEVQP
jgi:Ca2+-binding RTX toxin-like protein